MWAHSVFLLLAVIVELYTLRNSCNACSQPHLQSVSYTSSQAAPIISSHALLHPTTRTAPLSHPLHTTSCNSPSLRNPHKYSRNPQTRPTIHFERFPHTSPRYRTSSVCVHIRLKRSFKPGYDPVGAQATCFSLAARAAMITSSKTSIGSRKSRA